MLRTQRAYDVRKTRGFFNWICYKTHQVSFGKTWHTHRGGGKTIVLQFLQRSVTESSREVRLWGGGAPTQPYFTNAQALYAINFHALGDRPPTGTSRLRNLSFAGALTPLKAALHRLNQAPIMQPDFPFQPQKVPVFYGWVILVVAIVGVLMSIPGQTAGVSVFTDPLIAATGLSRLALSNAYLIGTLTSGLLLPLGGVFIDRYGVRLVVVGASIWLALTLVYLSMSDRLALWISTSLSLDSAVPIAFLLLCLGFVSLRFSGQGMLTLVSRTALGKWFDRKRGRVSGTAGIFVAFGFSSAPLILSFFIDSLGWRGAWLCLSVLVGIGMSSIGWLLLRDNPEECGLMMDGRSPMGTHENTPASNPTTAPTDSGEFQPTVYPHSTPRDFTRSEALRTLCFGLPPWRWHPRRCPLQASPSTLLILEPQQDCRKSKPLRFFSQSPSFRRWWVISSASFPIAPN
ncbi:MAG: MFS transporter [Cyanobacteria bacterium J06638_22]